MSDTQTLDVSKINIHEVAKQANVSIASVSRALNNKPGVSEKTKNKILAICEELGFATGGYARELVNKHRDSVAISMGPFYQASRYLGLIWPAISIAMREQGKSLLPIELDENNFDQIGGVVLLSAEHDDPRIKTLKEKNIPFVCLGIVEGEFWVASDDFNGGRLATQHLLDTGKRNIAFVTPNAPEVNYQSRLQGYTSILASEGVAIHTIRTGKDPIGELAAYQAIMDLEQSQLDAIDGLVCENDEIALGAKTALIRRGVEVPGQIAVVGYDGIPSISDGLTTVVQDYKKIAEHIANLLVKAANNEAPTGIVVPVSLKKGLSS